MNSISSDKYNLPRKQKDRKNHEGLLLRAPLSFGAFVANQVAGIVLFLALIISTDCYLPRRQKDRKNHEGFILRATSSLGVFVANHVAKNLAGIVLFLALIFSTEKLFAQTDTFMVANGGTTVSIVPNDSWFYLNEDYPVKITYKSKNKFSRVELKGGTATKKDSLYVLRAETGAEVVLVVYEKNKNGKEQVALSKTYKLYGRMLPAVNIDGVGNDSVTSQITLIALGRLHAKNKYSKEVYRVDSFCLYLRGPLGTDTLWSKTNQMTPEMKKRVDAIDVKKSGGMLVFDEIHATSPDGKDVTLPPLRVFLSRESRLRFGI